MRARLQWAFAATLVVVAMPARAADSAVKQCLDANERSIELGTANKLGAARAQLLSCAATTCPDEVRAECARRLGELDAAMPSIVLAAKDEAGHVLSSVRVSLDGRPWLSKLDGTPASLDPGPHELLLEAPGRQPVQRSIVVNKGEKRRSERASFGPAAGGATARTPSPGHEPAAGPPASGDEPAPGRDPAWLAGGLVTAGLGLVGIVVGAVFGARASSQWSSSKSSCESSENCPDHAQAVDEHDAAVTSANVSTATLAIGGAALATGAVVFFAAPSVEPGPAAGVGLRLGGAF